MSTINLLPKDYVQRRAERRANVLCISLFVAVMAGVFGAGMVSERNTKQTQDVRDRVNANYAKAAEVLATIQQLEVQKREGVRKAKATASLLERVPRSYVLAVLTQALPKHTSIKELSLKPVRRTRAARTLSKKQSKFAAAKKKAHEQKPPEMVMSLEVLGWATTDMQVGEFIGNLLGSPLLRSVNLDYSREKRVKAKVKGDPDFHVREFKVIMELRPNVDVIDLIEVQPATALELRNAPSGTSEPVPGPHAGPEGTKS